MTSTLIFLAIVCVCALMLWGSYKIEPHWVSKDGQRMVCYGQGISNRGEPYGRWRELRLARMNNGTMEIKPRHGSLTKERIDSRSSIGSVISGSGAFKRRNERASYWRVNGASADPPPRRIIYLLDGSNDSTLPELIAIRLPLKSRAIPILEEMAANKSTFVTELLASGRNQGTTQSEARPDQD